MRLVEHYPDVLEEADMLPHGEQRWKDGNSHGDGNCRLEDRSTDDYSAAAGVGGVEKMD